VVAAPADIRALMRQAAEAQQAGRPAAAIDLLRRAIAGDPRALECRAMLGELLLRLERLDEAVACFEALVALHDAEPGAHIALGNALQAKRDYASAIGCFRAAIARQPTNAAAHFNLGNALKAAGDLDAAAASFAEVIRLQPGLTAAHLNLGVVRFEQNRLADAEAALREAQRLRPNDALSFRQLVLVLIAAGRLDEAAAAILQAVERERGVGTAPDPKSSAANRIKLRHDADQFAWLADGGLLPPALTPLVADYEDCLRRHADAGDEAFPINSADPPAVVAHYNRLLHVGAAAAKPAGALRRDWDGAAVEAAFRQRQPGFAWFDGLLTPEALPDLWRFCLESTVWFQMTFKNEVSATCSRGSVVRCCCRSPTSCASGCRLSWALSRWPWPGPTNTAATSPAWGSTPTTAPSASISGSRPTRPTSTQSAAGLSCGIGKCRRAICAATAPNSSG
jgi:tetratricopeptide (TPR) repeat protein